MKLCHTCQTRHIDFSSKGNPEEAMWIKKEKLTPVPTIKNPSEWKVSQPTNSDIEITLKQDTLPPRTKILYWAAEPKKLTEANEIDNALTAYNRKGKRKLTNIGCTLVKKNGDIVITVKSPRCYKEKNELWPKHIHFVKEKNGVWDDTNFFTVLGIPSITEKLETKKLKDGNVYITPSQVMRSWKKNTYYMVFALPKHYYSLADINKYKDYNHIHVPYNSKSIRIPSEVKKSTPLVVYCASKTCDASKKLLVRLAEKGYENLFYMDAGMMGFSDESREIFEHSNNKRKVNEYSMMIGRE